MMHQAELEKENLEEESNKLTRMGRQPKPKPGKSGKTGSNSFTGSDIDSKSANSGGDCVMVVPEDDPYETDKGGKNKSLTNSAPPRFGG